MRSPSISLSSSLPTSNTTYQYQHHKPIYHYQSTSINILASTFSFPKQRQPQRYYSHYTSKYSLHSQHCSGSFFCFISLIQPRILTMDGSKSQAPRDHDLSAGLLNIFLILFVFSLLSAIGGLASTLHNIWEYNARHEARRCFQWVLMGAAAALGIASVATMISHRASRTPGTSFVTACKCFMAMITVTLYQVWERSLHRISVLERLSGRSRWETPGVLGAIPQPIPLASLLFFVVKLSLFSSLLA